VDILFWAHLFNGLLMIAMPVGLAIYLTRRWKLGWGLWFIGAATFILSQVGHIPFNAAVGAILNKTSMVDWPKSYQTIFNAVFGGLSAGLFEESFRYGMFRWWAKDARSWKKGILAGAGHGGAEAIILGGLVLYSFFQLTVYRHIDLSSVVPADQLEVAKTQITAYWSATWYAALLGAVERFFTIPVQIALSVIVLQTFTRKQWFWVWLAVLYHAFIDASTVYLLKPLGTYWTEALVGGFAVLSVIIIFSLRQPDPDIPQPDSVSPTPATLNIKPPEETPDNLDNSKFQ
jgi:uncharacterized membrane protein YhfC